MNRCVLVSCLVILFAVVTGGCNLSEDELLDECGSDDECPDGAICIERTCKNEPAEGDSCPDEYQGQQHEGLVCDDGSWQASIAVLSVTSEPPTVQPGNAVTMSVEVDSEFDDEELTYEWTAPPAWELAHDDAAQVELTAPNEPAVVATIEVTVTDPEGQSDSGEVDVSTHDTDGPEIQSIEAEPAEAIPGTHQVITVEATHPDDHELEYHWQLPDEWQADGEPQGDVIEVVAPEEHGASGEVEVAVVDEFGQEIPASVTVRTEDLFCGGQGTASEPWEVCSAKFVNRIGFYEELLGDHFELTADVDMDAVDEEFYVIGDSGDPFAGVFDGGGHVIENLVVDIEENEAGLFGRADDDAEIFDVVLLDAEVQGEDRVGLLMGRNDGTVRDIDVSGVAKGDSEVGGLVGDNHGDLMRTSADTRVEGQELIGGLVGRNFEDIEQSKATGDVEVEGQYAGGLVARNLGSVADSYATGEVDGDSRVGGLIGGDVGVVKRAYSTGNILGAGDHVGGLVGNFEGQVEDSVWNVDEDDDWTAPQGVKTRTTEEMKLRRNFPASWEFYPDGDSVWVMREDVEGVVRPSLGWEHTCGDDDSSCETGVCDETVERCVRCNVNSDDEFGVGDGSADDPWGICTEEHLENATNENHLSADFALFADIELSQPWDYFDVIGFEGNDDFQGQFDGKGHGIKNFHIESSPEPAGLFGTIGEDGEVHNLVLYTPEVSGSEHVGALAGQNFGTVESCHVESGYVHGEDIVGGLVGLNEGEIHNASFSGDVGFEGDDDIVSGGGLVGANVRNSLVSHSSSTVEIVGEGEDIAVVGGLVGSMLGGVVEDSFAKGDAIVESQVRAFGGGLVGQMSGATEFGSNGNTLRRSFADVDVHAQANNIIGPDSDGSDDFCVVCVWAGGLVGVQSGYDDDESFPSSVDAIVEDSYALGAVNAEVSTEDPDLGETDIDSFAGGLVGLPSSATLERGYATGMTLTSAVWPGGMTGSTGNPIVGDDPWGNSFDSLYWDITASSSDESKVEATGLESDEFENADHFDGNWDFDDVWTIGEAPDGVWRPIFQWQ